MVASWCRLRHQSTAKWTIGTLTNPAMPTMAARRLRTSVSAGMRRMAR